MFSSHSRKEKPRQIHHNSKPNERQDVMLHVDVLYGLRIWYLSIHFEEVFHFSPGQANLKTAFHWSKRSQSLLCGGGYQLLHWNNHSEENGVQDFLTETHTNSLQDQDTVRLKTSGDYRI